MGDLSNPSKKPRLDELEGDQDIDDDESMALWGQINFTAEELDMLEEKATQEAARQENQVAVQQVTQVADHDKDKNNVGIGQTASFSVVANEENEKAVLDQLKLEQYALEGKNKALSELLTKTLKELNDERLNREQMIDLKLAKLTQTKINLHQEIEKLNTTLLFKDQELRVERNKIHALENKLKKKADGVQVQAGSSFHETPVKQSLAKKSPNKLPNWCSFDYRNKPDTVESEIQTDILRYRKYPLQLQARRGKPQETDAVCKLLSSRIVDSCCERNVVHDSESGIDPMNEIFKQARDHSSMCVTTLRYNGESDVWRPYEVVLQEYVSRLKAERSSLKLATEKVFIFSEGMSHSNLNQQNGILSCLRSLTRLLFHRCPKGNSRYSKELNCNKSGKKGNLEVYTVSSLPLFNGDEDKVEVAQKRSYSLLELLIMLANPTTYPDDYKKTYEMEWALSALVAWSSHSKESLESYTQDLPFHSLVSGSQGMECAYLTLKLMSSLIGLTSFKGALAHHSDSWCILCSIGNLCECIPDNHPGNASGLFMSVIENFLFAILNCYGFEKIAKEACPCSSQLLQGVITMLSRQLRSSQDCALQKNVSVIRKGVMLLCFMAAHLPNFRARRLSVGEKYISLICELTRLCKKDPEFKKFQDKVKELWDFQDEIAEFDTEEMHGTQNPSLQAPLMF